jgi:hypothetical protein
MNTKVVFDEKKKAYAAYDNGKLLGYYRSEADAKDAIEFNRTTARLSAHVGLAGSDFARDLKEMMDAWDKYRAIWIKKHGNDEGFAKWYKEQIAGLEKKAKSSPPQFKDAGANDKQESNKDFMKRIGSRRNGYSAKTASTSLSAICDRELARVGLSMWSSGSEAGAKSIAEREGLFYGFSILNGKWYVGTKEELDKIGVAKILGGNSLSAICDRELARVGLAYQGGWGTDNGPEDSKGGTVWTYEIDEDEADEMTYVKARSVGTGERKEFTIKAAPISNIRQIVEAHAKAR